MKNKKIIFPLLIALSTLCKCEQCYKNDTYSLEVYCKSFTATMPNTCIPFDHDTNLNNSFKYLKIGGCDGGLIENFVFRYSVSFLDISYSKYTELSPFAKKHENLVKLNASYNGLHQISLHFFLQTPNLKEIDFSHNKIDTIKKSDFVGGWLLTTIHLAHNRITSVENETFVKLNDLTFIDLTNNSIEYFKGIFRNNTKLRTVLLKDNPILSFTCEFLRLAKTGVSLYFAWDTIGTTDMGTHVNHFAILRVFNTI